MALLSWFIGIAGAFGWGFAGSRISFGTASGFDLPSLVIAAGGAILLLVIYRFF